MEVTEDKKEQDYNKQITRRNVTTETLDNFIPLESTGKVTTGGQRVDEVNLLRRWTRQLEYKETGTT